MHTLKGLTFALSLSLVLAGCQAPTTVGVAGGKAIGAKSAVGNAQRAATPKRQPTQILVKFKAERMHAQALNAFRAEFGTRNVGMIAALGIYIEEITTDAPLMQVLKEIQASPLVEYAEPNGEVSIQN